MVAHIAIVGQMGAGKTTVGRLVAGAIGWPFCDNDVALEQRIRVTAALMQARQGVEALHAAELGIVTELLHEPEPSVVAAPASVVLAPEHDELWGMAFVAWLHVSPEVLAERAAASVHRPVPQHKRAAFFERLVGERDALYAGAADLRVDADALTPGEAADRIVRATAEWRAGLSDGDGSARHDDR
jgi:shikimate kinase